MQSILYIASNSPPIFHVPWKPHKTHILSPSQTLPIIHKPLTISNSLKTSFEEEKLDKSDEPTSPARLPVVIRRSGSVSRYLWDGRELKLVSVDGNSFSLSLDFEDGFRRLFRICSSGLRNFFLPGEVCGNYLEYVKWKFLHRVFSSALQVLATQAMFRAIGIGYSHSLPSAAALNWVLKDGLGRLSRCIYTASLASSFDTNLKRVRFSTSVLFSLSIGVELLTPAFPQYFLLVASIANIAKQISLACYLATGTAVHRSFAVADNLGEVSAKAQIQTVCFDNLGLMLAAALNILFRNNLRLPQIEKMPRKPKRHCQLTKPHPFTFSPFARSVARVANSYKVKSQIQNSKFHRKSSPNSSGDKLGYHSLADKSEPSESSDEEEFEGIVQADFAFFDPKPDDFHGVKVLLQTYLDDKQWDLSGFVDLILGQTTVGTIVKIEEDEDDTPYSVVTALNLRRYKDHICIKELKEFLLQVCKEKDLLDNLKLVFGEQAQTVGLLVSQRVVNLPPQLLPPLHDALFDEVSWATEDEPTEELRKSFCFKHYLLVTRIYEHKNAGQKEAASNSSEEAIVYVKSEDEIFYQLSSWSFRFPLRTQQLASHELRNYRLMGLVMALEAEKVLTFRQQLHSLINES